eukprot:568682-Lingulodinium_polyedra.AAC.1
MTAVYCCGGRRSTAAYCYGGCAPAAACSSGALVECMPQPFTPVRSGVFTIVYCCGAYVPQHHIAVYFPIMNIAKY